MLYEVITVVPRGAAPVAHRGERGQAIRGPPGEGGGSPCVSPSAGPGEGAPEARAPVGGRRRAPPVLRREGIGGDGDPRGGAFGACGPHNEGKGSSYNFV